MAKQAINIGAEPNDGTGDPLRVAMDATNQNFNEVYNALGGNTVTNLINSNGQMELVGTSNKLSFLYDEESDVLALDPAIYHGCVAHAHNTGKLYYAHGTWRKLLSDNSASDITSYTDPLNPFVYTTKVTNSETADYVLKSNNNGTYTWVPQAGGGFTLTVQDEGTGLTTGATTLNFVGDGVVASGTGATKTITIAGGAATTSLQLTDTPSSYGTAGQVLRVNSGADGLEFATVSGGGGASAFIDLTDTPGALGSAGQILQVNSGGSALEFVAAPAAGVTTFVALSDTPGALGSAGQILQVNSGGTALEFVAAPAAGVNTFVALSDTPGALGSAGQILQVNSGGTALEFATASGGSGASRANESVTSTALGASSSADQDFTAATLGLSYHLHSVTTSHAAWVRVYTDAAARTADNSRTQGQDPAEGAGLVAEFITGAGATIKISPAIAGWVDGGSIIPVRVTNLDAAQQNLQVTINTLKLE